MRRIQKDHADQKYTLDGFRCFIENVIKWEDDPNKYQEIAEHQEYWLRYIFRGIAENRSTLIKAPWEHGKTWIVAIPLPLYLIGVNPNIRGATICSTDDCAKDRIMAIREYIDDDEDYHEAFPHVVKMTTRPWTKHELTVKREVRAKDPTWQGAGVDGRRMGKRLDFLMADDVCDMEDQLSEATRNRKDDKFNGTWLSRLDGPCFYIATPWHYDDVTARTQNEKQHWLKLSQKISRDLDCIQMHFGDKDHNSEPDKVIPLWNRADRQTQYFIDKQGEISSKLFRAGYHFDLASEEDATFDWGRIEPASFKHKISPRELYKPTWPMVGGVDISSANRKGTTIGVAARAPDGTRVPVHMEAGNWAVGPETARQIIRVDNVIRALGARVGIWMVENNGIQQVIINCLREVDKAFRVKGFQTGKNKADWEDGLPGLAAQMEGGGWAFGMRDHTFNERTCRIYGLKDCAWCRLVREIKEHPFSRTSDLVMMLWFIDVGLGKKKKIKLEKPVVLGQPRQFAAKTSERKFKAPPVRIYP